MNHHKTDQEWIEKTKNVARFFVESRQIAWVLFGATILWGVYALFTMPQRKDPVVPVRVAAAVLPWPGSSAERLEQLAVKPVEERIVKNDSVIKLETVVRTGVAVFTFELDRRTQDVGKEFDDIRLKLDDLQQQLPAGAGPIQFIKDFGDTTALMLTVASPKLPGGAQDKYSPRELDDFTQVIEKTLKADPIVAKVERTGVQRQTITLSYSQQRLAALNVPLANLAQALQARNITATGARVDTQGRSMTLLPTGEFQNEADLGNVLIPDAAKARMIPLRNLVSIERGYADPATFLNFYTYRDAQGQWQRAGAVTLAVNMREGEKIVDFSERVDAMLADLKGRMPADLIWARTSDEPQQVHDSVAHFARSLIEAIALVVLISWIGFREWRSALVLALAIPITLLMTFGMMQGLGVEIHQVSIASLILALGLLVDDPVVAGDAIKRELGNGHRASIAAWLGPTKLSRAIFFATVTNIAAYLPFLLLKGDTGEFIYSLPIVMTCSLVASRLVSMTFIPLFGAYLLKPEARPEEAAWPPKRGFAALYHRFGQWAIAHRWAVLGSSLAILLLLGLASMQVKSMYSPKDLANLFYIEVWLPEDAALSATDQKAAQVEKILERVSAELDQERGEKNPLLVRHTTFVGGGGPRFWYSVSPELEQPNYAQIVAETSDKYDTEQLVTRLQQRIDHELAGARVDVRQLDTTGVTGMPVALRISGTDLEQLRRQGERLKEIVRSSPLAARVRDNWGGESFAVQIDTDAARANLSGISHADVRNSANAGLDGAYITELREGDRQLPVLLRLAPAERQSAAMLSNMYVFSEQGSAAIPLKQVAQLAYGLRPEKIVRRNQFRSITISAAPAAGHFPSEVMAQIRPQLEQFEKSLPPGYRFEIAGEEEEANRGNLEMTIVLGVCIFALFLALVFQFRNAVKPLLVFAAIPFGMLAGTASLWVMGVEFGFMAFLGIISLVGVIVSHVIVLFDFIEEAAERGASLPDAVLQAGVIRLRPVLVTVGATVIGLFPLAASGGPLWQPLCYAQIGGLSFATVITLVLVPVLYAIFVLDLKLIRWEADAKPEAVPSLPANSQPQPM